MDALRRCLELLESGCHVVLVTVLKAGGGHVGRALAPILESLGFRATIFDSRPESRERFSGPPQQAVVIGDCTDISPVKQTLVVSEFCFIATHGHVHDYQVLKQLLQATPHLRYAGLIGSRDKVRDTLQRLREEGMSVPEILYAPVGLAIGGATPAEIAVSIAAEVVAVMNGATAPHMRDRINQAGSETG